MTTLRFFEDIAPGEIAHAGPLVVTREAIVAFARQYDPQSFHLDERAAARSLLGGLAASGWQTTALGMRLYYDGFVRHVASMGAPGVDEVRWLRPVRPGDALRLVLHVGAKRPSASRPDRGFVSMTLDIHNAADETVMTQRGPIIIARAGATQIPAATHAATVPSASATAPADPMLSAAFDEIVIGHQARLGTQLFSADLITSFAGLYDPQYFHTDPEAARSSHFGGLIASGWQTAAFWMKHYIAARDRSVAARAAAGLEATVGGPSPGFAGLKWHRPVRVGERITYGMEVTGKRRTSRDGWALVTTFNTGHSGDGTLAFSFEGRLLWPCASGPATPAPL